MAKSCHEDKNSPILPLHPLNPGRSDGPLKALEKENSYQLDSTVGSDYTAILLAAGYGSRISGMTDAPKCLLKLNDATLLEHHLNSWRKAGIRKVNLVLGYKSDDVRAVAEKHGADFDFTFSLNEEYKCLGNAYSFLVGLKDCSGPILIFDADLIYEQEILEDFIKDQGPSQILTGEGKLVDEECSKVLLDESKFVRKIVDKRLITEDELSQFFFAGEALGILKFSDNHRVSLARHAEKFLSKEGNLILNWEHLMNEFLPLNDVSVHQSANDKWIEIDTPEDFKDAQRIFES